MTVDRTCEVVSAKVDELVAAKQSDWQHELTSLLDGVEEYTLQEIEGWARDTLRKIPTPLRPSTDSELERRRAIISRLAAEIAARCDRPDELVDVLFEGWRARNESPIYYIELLVELGRNDEAAAMARLTLRDDTCPDRSRIQAALEAVAVEPEGWKAAVLDFAEDPSVQAWERLMSFTPVDAFYHRTRNTLQMLIRLGVDGDVLFQCATRWGTVPDAIELVERGLVKPETVVQRGRDGPAPARGLWLGLAAQAALARGDRFLTVRLLREALEYADPEFPPLMDLEAIRNAADDELNEMLDKAGIP